MGLIIKDFIDETQALRKECYVRLEQFRSKTEYAGILCTVYFYHNYENYLKKAGFIAKKSLVIPFNNAVYSDKLSTLESLYENKNETLLLYEFLKTIDGNNLSEIYPSLNLRCFIGIDFTKSISTFSQNEINSSKIDGLSNLKDGDIYYNEDLFSFQEFREGLWYLPGTNEIVSPFTEEAEEVTSEV